MEEDDASGKSNSDSISPTPKHVFISTLRATLGMLQRGSVIPPSALQQLRPVSKSVSQLLEAYNRRLRDNTFGGLDDSRQRLIRRVEREIDECAVDLDSTPNPPDRGTIKIRRHVSQKKVIANHQKAFRSTGPRTREGTRRKSRKRATAALGPIPQIIARIPRPYPPSGEALGALITDELTDIWESILSDSDLHEPRWSEPLSATISEKLDALILKQAETMGWRLGLSELVCWRFSEWEFQPNGPALLEQYGKALAKSARRFQKREPPPIDDPDLYRLKQETVLELRLFLRNLRNGFTTRRIQPSSDELIDYFRKTVSAEGVAFIHLKTNINSWLQYFRADSIPIKSLLHGKRATPAALFDSWLAWSKGLDPETIRQKVSELGRFIPGSTQVLKL